MTSPRCADVARWLTHAEELIVPAALAEHVASCPHCGGALAALARELAGAPPPVISCDACQDALPALLDREQEIGLRAAARTAPATWWHLAGCPTCTEVYELMRQMLGAPAPAHPGRAARPLALRVGRATLVATLGALGRLGQAWGVGEPALLAEAAVEAHQADLLATVEGAWCHLAVALRPAAPGAGVLLLGQQVQVAPLDRSGVARFAPISVDDLAAAGGPDLLISLALDSPPEPI